MRSDSMAQRCGHHQHPNASTPPPVDTRGDNLDLPNASADPPGPSRRLSDLRHGAGTGDRDCRGGAERRTRRHDPPLLDRARAQAAGAGSDRKSVVEGTGVAVRVDLGGRRIITTKTRPETYITNN